MNLKPKKIIAREGLIVLGWIGCIVLSLFTVYNQPPFEWVTTLVVFGYPIYLFIRFIIWAIRTLRQKEQ